ncbi:hypothetical protein [Streptomyces sp. NPDC057694]|uniref:hypothetical protein n=1 Tax=Streptomyces sp. NPDC057694 TaxID=3346216 RepID=UPI0036CC1108
MAYYLASVPVDFTKEPTKTELSDLNDALAPYDPRGSRGSLSWRHDAAGDVTFNLVVETADDQEAKSKARETLTAALFDNGRRNDTATVRAEDIEIIPWK